MTAPAAIVDFAADLLAAINAGEYAMSFTAIKHYLVYLDRAQLNCLRVAVAPMAITDEPATRGGVVDEEFSMWVGMQMPVKPDDTTTIDTLLLVNQQIRDLVRFASFGNATWVKTEVPLLFEPSDLALKNQFTSVSRFVFTAYRTP